MVVLDLVSRGRVSYVAAIGYRPVEYAMYGVDWARRGKIADEKLAVLLAAKTGRPFEHEGRHIQVTPAPFTRGGPSVAWGGGSRAAARRAGRNGIGFIAQKEDPELRAAYREAARAAGREPGLCVLPPRDAPTAVFVAHDVERAWDELGPYLLHDAKSYAEWNEGNEDVTSLSFAGSIDELRAEERSHRILGVDEAIARVRAGSLLALHPLIGGLPPELAWRYLRVVTDEVLPEVRATPSST